MLESMGMSDLFIERLKEQIAHYQSLLEPLESGKLWIGEIKDGAAWTDRTQAQIDHIKGIIRTLQSVVERG
jgi:hypothetical protein